MAEVPFDSDYKFMATFHRWIDRDGRDVVRCFVKGAPGRAGRAGRPLPGRRRHRAPATRAVQEGYARATPNSPSRACAYIARGRPGLHRRPTSSSCDDPKDLLDRIVLVALVGIVDPPRPEARRGDRPVPRGRHPRADDHRRPRRHRRRRSPRTWASRARRSRARRWTGSPTTPTSPAGSTTSASSPGSPRNTRSASCARCRPAATSSR